MFTHQRPAIASRYSVPSASTTVEPRPSTITSGSASSCRCATTGCSTLSRSCRTTAVRPSTWEGAAPSGSVISCLLAPFWPGLYAGAPHAFGGPLDRLLPALALLELGLHPLQLFAGGLRRSPLALQGPEILLHPTCGRPPP